MFTGIIEAMGSLLMAEKEGCNVHFTFACPFTQELKTDQSLAHNGVCLTVVKTSPESYTVTAIEETLKKTNLGSLQAGDWVNLERCVKVDGRLDGHIVQGHVDQVAECTHIEKLDGSHIFHFSYDTSSGHITVPKGSIAVNGVSLTVVNSGPGNFSVAIIPFTLEHTNFGKLKVGDSVNLEFDILGKYVQALAIQSRDLFFLKTT